MDELTIANEGMKVRVRGPDARQDWGYGVIESVKAVYFPRVDGLSCGGFRGFRVHRSANYPAVIRLDNGESTEGCECWWYPAEWDTLFGIGESDERS